MTNSRILQLMLGKGIGNVAIKKVFAFLDDNRCSIEDAFASKTVFAQEIGLRESVVESIYSMKEKADRIAEDLNQEGVILITERDTLYPKYLKQTLKKECPPVLFAKGNAELLNERSVGFCGSRKASSKGLGIAGDCARQLAEKNITVISGYASGADLTAHSAALRNGGNTIFVLPEGIMRSTIKSEVRDLIDDKNHLFVSQFLPNITWNAGNAMKRNGIIIGLSRAMILVESGKTGGTFAAGEEALRVGCPLFVIDFEKPEVSAEANPYFINAGGFPIRGKKGIPSLDRVFEVVNGGNDIRTQITDGVTVKKSSEYFEQIRIDI